MSVLSDTIRARKEYAIRHTAQTHWQAKDRILSVTEFLIFAAVAFIACTYRDRIWCVVQGLLEH